MDFADNPGTAKSRHSRNKMRSLRSKLPPMCLCAQLLHTCLGLVIFAPAPALHPGGIAS